jgi:hypothetical protein
MADHTNAFTDPHQARLAAAVGFTPDDLRANRKQRLTARQVQRLRGDLRRQYWPTLAALGVLGVIALALALFSTADPLLWVVPMAGVGALAIFAAQEMRGGLRGTEAGPQGVASVILHVPDGWQPLRRASVIEFPVGPRWFTLPRAVQPALEPGRRYRLYYAPDILSHPFRTIPRTKSRSTPAGPVGSYRVLSIEPVRHPNPGGSAHS